MFNVSFRRVGGLRFLKVGRLTVSWSVARAYRPVKSAEQSAEERNDRALDRYYADLARYERTVAPLFCI